MLNIHSFFATTFDENHILLNYQNKRKTFHLCLLSIYEMRYRITSTVKYDSIHPKPIHIGGGKARDA